MNYSIKRVGELQVPITKEEILADYKTINMQIFSLEGVTSAVLFTPTGDVKATIKKESYEIT